MSSINEYQGLKYSLLALSKELIEHIESKWTNDWSEISPKVGIHFSYWEIKELPSYEMTISELGKFPNISDKYSDDSLEKPVGTFLEMIISSIPNPTFVDKAFNYWWIYFLKLLESNNVTIQLYIGLSNFKSDQEEFRFDKENAIYYYGDKSLKSVLNNLPIEDPYPSTGVPLHLIPGAIKVEFLLPADRETLDYDKYTHECINRMNPLKNALYLSSFGRLVVGPWIPICNPSFPVDGVYVIGDREARRRIDDVVFHLNEDSWQRFKEVYTHLKRIKSEEFQRVTDGRAKRRRFNLAISRFLGTFNQGYWESVIVDLVIVMESLLTPNRQGGRMQLALAASNLLGTTSSESKEIFENVTNMYKLRNANVHGEPMTTETWDKRILEIARTAGSKADDLRGGVREFAFEVMRDYARRSIVAMLNLHFRVNRSPSELLTSDLHQLHLDKNLRNFIQSNAKCYSLESRPKPSR